MPNPFEDQIFAAAKKYRATRIIFFAAAALGLVVSFTNLATPILAWARPFVAKALGLSADSEMKTRHACAYRVAALYAHTIRLLLPLGQSSPQTFFPDFAGANALQAEIGRCYTLLGFGETVETFDHYRKEDFPHKEQEVQRIVNRIYQRIESFKGYLARTDPLQSQIYSFSNELQMSLLILDAREIRDLISLSLNKSQETLLTDSGAIKHIETQYTELRNVYPYALPPLTPGTVKFVDARLYLHTVENAFNEHFRGAP